MQPKQEDASGLEIIMIDLVFSQSRARRATPLLCHFHVWSWSHEQRLVRWERRLGTCERRESLFRTELKGLTRWDVGIKCFCRPVEFWFGISQSERWESEKLNRAIWSLGLRTFRKDWRSIWSLRELGLLKVLHLIEELCCCSFSDFRLGIHCERHTVPIAHALSINSYVMGFQSQPQISIILPEILMNSASMMRYHVLRWAT